MSSPLRASGAALFALLLALQTTLAANLTTTSVQNAGQDWTAAIWKTNGTGTAVGPVAGNTYEAISNGTPFGNNKNNTRLRNPVLSPVGTTTFPGNSLTLDTNAEIRIKGPGMRLNFPGVGANPGFVLNGGVLNVGDEAVFEIAGRVSIAGQSYICPADAGGGAVKPLRGVKLTAQLSGNGSVVILLAGTTVAQEIACTSNTFSGQWVVKAGWLLGSGVGSLGTNSILIDPGYMPPLDPSVIDTEGPALFEPAYDLNSAGKLTLTNGGVMNLHQNCVFSAVTIEGSKLSAGTHSYASLAASFPNNFATGGSGSLTVQPYGSPPVFPPTFVTQPASTNALKGSPVQLSATVSGIGPVTYQWQRGTNGIFVNETDQGDITGSQSSSLNFSAIALADAADYRVIAANSAGHATSTVATVSVTVPDTTHPAVASLSPAAGATVGSLTQISVTFTKNVIGVSAGDLQIDGTPAATVAGSGSNYVFTFTQPAPGTIPIYWDADNAITDLSGNSLEVSGAWSYRLLDTVPPALAVTVPAPGATISHLSAVQVMFSEPVTGVQADSLLVNGQAATALSGSGFGPYVFQCATPTQGTVQFSWAAAQNIRDGAGNLFGGAGWSCTLNPAAAAAALTNIVLNEILAGNVNTNGLLDEDGALDDWIELYNRGSTPVNLSGWNLTTDASQPQMWTFPATNLAAGQYLVVFASEKDRRTPGAHLHTNFKLSRGGGYLGLDNADNPAIVAREYSPGYPEQRNDISYGLDASGAPRYFQTQTPGAANVSSTLTGIVAAVHFSVRHGFFNQPFNLVLTTETPGAVILYTTNGSYPSLSGPSTNGVLYTGRIAIDHTTALRAAAFAPNLLPTDVGSQTYLFIEDIVHQPNNPSGYPTGNVWTPTPSVVQNGSRAYYQMDPAIVNDPQYSNSVRAGLLSIPSMSIIMPIADLFDPVNGLYTHPMSRSTGWERACSMELVFPDGETGAQIDCGIQIQGGTQRDPAKNAKHSFRVLFKNEYGTSKFSYPFFPDSPVQGFKTFVLDGGINYWWNYVGGNVPLDQRFRTQCVRDQYTSDLMLALGWPSFHGRFYHLYLNGLYWGLHYVHERPDDDFAASYFGGDNSNYDVLKNTTYGLQIVAGDGDAWNTALALANSGLTNNAQYLQLQQYVDIDNLIDYMIVNHWAGNDDWPQHNWYVIRNRVTADGFKFIIWDAEHVLKDVNENVTTANTDGSPAQIYLALVNNAEFRLRYADHLQKHFFNGGLFYMDPNPTNAVWNPAHPERNIPASYYLKRINEIDSAIVDESARWGGYLLTTNYTRNDHWLRELNNLLGYTNTPGNTANYFPQRSGIVLNQYRAIGLFPGVSAPVFSQQGGNVPLGFALLMTNLNSGGKIFYTTNGTDPRVFGSGAVSLSARAYTNGAPLVLNSSAVVKARVLNGSWSALSEAEFDVALLGIPVRITEIMYHPIGGDAYEYIELQNIGATDVDLSGFSFQGVTYVFPVGSTLRAGALIVLASGSNPSAFATRYPGVAVAGNYSGALANSGERLALLDAQGHTIISVDYKDSGGWPTGADGGGYSLEMIDSNGDPDSPSNWRQSLAVNGSPGIANAPAAPSAIRFNEIMAENAGAVPNGGTYPDWLELFNAGTNAAELSNWSLSNSGNLRKFVFPPATTIAAGGYLVVWCDSETNAPGLHSGFTLGRKGEDLALYDPATNRIDALSFGLQLTNYSLGRVGLDGSWQLTVPTPGSNNVAAAIGQPASLVLNEWLANSVPGGSDWVELYNTSSNLPVSLQGCYLQTSNAFYEIRSLSFIAPNGFAQLLADESPGADHLDFNLTAAGDSLTLISPAGAPVDRIQFGGQIEGVSQGRFPDGSTNFISFPGTASPAASNYLPGYVGPRLSRIMARNAGAVSDSRGNHPAWLQLTNRSVATFDLSGMGLSSGGANAADWVFPAGSVLPGNGVLTIWCDSSRPASTTLETDLNAGLKLNGTGTTVRLYSTNGQTVDAVSFGFQLANDSIGLTSAGWALLDPLQPGNIPAALGNPAQLRVNEWMAAPLAGNDWFELFNPGLLPVSLSGLYLSDDPSLSGITNSQLGPLSFIAPGSWVLLQADGQPSQGPDHVRFSLNHDGETIRLYNTDLSLIDAVDFGLQATGVSQGRIPDGGGEIESFAKYPTPGSANVPDDSGGNPSGTPLFDSFSAQAGLLTFRFTAVAGHGYTVQFRDELTSGTWQTLTVIAAPATNSNVTINDSIAGTTRFYRLVRR